MEHFLERYRNYQGKCKALIAYAAELEFSGELTGDLFDKYDDMLELLEEELEEQGDGSNQMYENDTEHLLCQNELR